MLYHYETGIPFKLNLPTTLDLHYSNHALRAAQNDRYGCIDLEDTIATKGAKVIEVETCDRTGNPIKVLIRKDHDATTDVCFAIALNNSVGGKFVVKTVWLNKKSDLHRSLDKSRYAA